MTDAPSPTTSTHLEWGDFRIPISDCVRDADGRLTPPSPLPDPIPPYWDRDFEYKRPRAWLWRRAWDALDNFRMVHGEPLKLAREIVLHAEPFRLARDWLFHIEMLLRRILLLAAGDYAGAFAPSKHTARAKPVTARATPTLEHRLVHASFSSPLFARERHAPRPFRVAPMRDPHAHREPKVVDPFRHLRGEPLFDSAHDLTLDPPLRRLKRPPEPVWAAMERLNAHADKLRAAGVTKMMVETKPVRLIRLTRPLSVRLAACLRIFENPQPFVKRLARRMWREQNHHGRNAPRQMSLAPYRGYDRSKRSFGQRSISRCFPLADWLVEEVVAIFNAPLRPVPS